MIFDILTIFPDLLESPLQEGIIRQAREKQQIEVNLTNIRDFATDKHQMTDDRPFGGGPGMVMKPEPLAAATKQVKNRSDNGKVILLSPPGLTLNQAKVEKLASQEHIILVCGRYEGVDTRYVDNYVDEEISIGDFILTGGELAAMVIVDAVIRLLPGVLGCSASHETDTFSRSLLKHSQYTRPREFEGHKVPEALLSGDHKKINDMRFVESVDRTIKLRPDLMKETVFSKEELKLLKQHNLLEKYNAVLAKDE